MSADFDYRTVPQRTSPAAVIGLLVVGILLLVGCGAWLLAPVITDAARTSTTGTVVSYAVLLAPGRSSTVEYTPTIRYAVDGREHTFAAVQSVTRADREQLPPGSHTTVRYLRSDPSDAVWAPSGSIIALNFWGTTGAALGVILIGSAFLLRRMNRIRDMRLHEGESR